MFCAKFFIEVSPSSYLGQTEGLAGNSKPIYEVCDSKSEKSASIYRFEGTPFLYIAFTWIVGLTTRLNLDCIDCSSRLKSANSEDHFLGGKEILKRDRKRTSLESTKC